MHNNEQCPVNKVFKTYYIMMSGILTTNKEEKEQEILRQSFNECIKPKHFTSLSFYFYVNNLVLDLLL